MREIKFRGKRLTDGKWIEGDFILLDGKAHIYERKNEYGGAGSWGVDPATVSQFTGLLDKDGKAIFEGDIVACVKFQPRPFMGVVKFDRGVFFMEGKNSKWAFSPVLLLSTSVVGNIHDTPELSNPKQS